MLHEGVGEVEALWCGAEAGHGEPDDAGSGPIMMGEGLGGDEEGEGAIESARDADDERCVRGEDGEAFGEAGTLDFEDFAAALGEEFGVVLGDEGLRGNMALK